uniref:Uncharacterized protein n=1 Tax=Favella ehrenbergii TaxID=182087 RepID=A0A7S3I751_9SPIT|mmetsp:Transcript_37417/g.45587  ORF Transcript_37417/g.45587 Transcript_37417/m.45587 type:complete len:176 (+) Transcript_37417:500-1027(+)
MINFDVLEHHAVEVVIIITIIIIIIVIVIVVVVVIVVVTVVIIIIIDNIIALLRAFFFILHQLHFLIFSRCDLEANLCHSSASLLHDLLDLRLSLGDSVASSHWLLIFLLHRQWYFLLLMSGRLGIHVGDIFGAGVSDRLRLCLLLGLLARFFASALSRGSVLLHESAQLDQAAD